MKAKSFFALVAAALTLAACAPKAPVVDPVFEVTGAAIKGNKIVAAAEGATAKFTVNSNLSWEAKSNAEWLTITPASAEGDKVNAKKVTVEVVVAANTATESRNTTIELNAPGYEPLTVTLAVEQAGLVPVFNVYEADMDPVANEEIVECDATEFVVNIESNVAFTTTSSEAWADVTELQDPQNTSTFLSGSVKFDANEGETRSTVITITPAGGLQPVSFTLTQEAPTPFTVSVEMMSVSEYAGQAIPAYPDYSCRITVMENPTKTVTAGYYGVWQSAAWTQAELDDPMELLLEYGNEMEADELDGLNGVEGADPCEWIWSKLNPGTEYVFVAGFVAEDGSVYTAYSKSTTDKEEDPGEAEAAYTKWIGTYNFEINGKTHVATISANVVNKSFIVDLSGADNSYIEDFAPVATWDKANDKLAIAQQTMGQWTHPQYGTITDNIYGMISYNGGYPLITGNGYAIASLSYNSGNVVIESAGSIDISGLGQMPLVGMSLFGVASAGNMRYCDEADFMLFPVTLNKAVASTSTKPVKASAQILKGSFGVKKAVKFNNFVELR